jgi:hypothetical protein
VSNDRYQPLLLALIPVCLGIWFDRYLLAGAPYSFAVQWATSLFALSSTFALFRAIKTGLRE